VKPLCPPPPIAHHDLHDHDQHQLGHCHYAGTIDLSWTTSTRPALASEATTASTSSFGLASMHRPCLRLASHAPAPIPSRGARYDCHVLDLRQRCDLAEHTAADAALTCSSMRHARLHKTKSSCRIVSCRCMLGNLQVHCSVSSVGRMMMMIMMMPVCLYATPCLSSVGPSLSMPIGSPSHL
jgi:hypothetical protein